MTVFKNALIYGKAYVIIKTQSCQGYRIRAFSKYSQYNYYDFPCRAVIDLLPGDDVIHGFTSECF